MSTMINDKKPGMNKPDHATFDDVRDDIRSLKSDVTGTVSDLAEAGGDLARDAARHVSAQAKNVCKTTERAIAERPLTSVLIAVGVGAVLAKLLSRR